MSRSKNCGTFTQWSICSRKKEETLNFHDSMDGTGECYSKCNKPVGERQIPYDLSCKRNIMNKSNLMNKIEPQAWKHGTD